MVGTCLETYENGVLQWKIFAKRPPKARKLQNSENMYSSKIIIWTWFSMVFLSIYTIIVYYENYISLMIELGLNYRNKIENKLYNG